MDISVSEVAQMWQYARAQQLKEFELWADALQADRPEKECEHHRLACASWARCATELYEQANRQQASDVG